MIKKLNKLHDSDRSSYIETRERIYDFFESRLQADRFALATTGAHFDAERKPIDTVVIHHTSMEPGITAERISAVDLFRLYAPQFAVKEHYSGGVYSGHFRYGVQVFWPYHWIVRRDGSCERLLQDREVGWQAGDWAVNCRSVAIVLDGDYEDAEPSDMELKAIAALVREHYPQIQKERILGHCEVNEKTTCPSKLFLPEDNHSGWKNRLLDMV